MVVRGAFQGTLINLSCLYRRLPVHFLRRVPCSPLSASRRPPIFDWPIQRQMPEPAEDLINHVATVPVGQP